MKQSLWKTAWRFFKKLKIELPYESTIPFLATYPEKTIIQKGTCTPMFPAALFTTAKPWNQPKCPSADIQISQSEVRRDKPLFLFYIKQRNFVVTYLDLDLEI